MALDEAARATLAVEVGDRIVGTVLGREASGGTAEREIARAAVDYCDDAAPAAPAAILREACILMAAWLYGVKPYASAQTMKDPSGTETSVTFRAGMTGNAWRNSGASAMLSRYIKRRAGVIG